MPHNPPLIFPPVLIYTLCASMVTDGGGGGWKEWMRRVGGQNCHETGGLHSPEAAMCSFEKTAVHLLHWLCALPLPPAIPPPSSGQPIWIFPKQGSTLSCLLFSYTSFFPLQGSHPLLGLCHHVYHCHHFHLSDTQLCLTSPTSLPILRPASHLPIRQFPGGCSSILIHRFSVTVSPCPPHSSTTT